MIKKKMFHLLNTVMIFYKITISHKVSPLSMILNIMMVALPSLNIDVKQKAIVSAFCVAGNCPTLPTVTEKKRGKNLEMFLVDYDMHQVLSELVDAE